MMLSSELPEAPAAADTLRRAWALPALTLLLIAAFVGALLVGSVSIPLPEVVTIVLHKVGLASSTSALEAHAQVFFAIRLPRVLLGVLVGAGLGLSGAAMQGLFRNPLVDPGLLGISSGAALGAVASIVLGVKISRVLPPAVAAYLLPSAAFVGALSAMLIVVRIGRVNGRMMVATLLLAGIAVNSLASALTGLFISLSNDSQLRTITFWIFGSLSGATMRTVTATALFLGVPLVVLLRFGRTLNALLLGEAEAGHLGIDVERAKRLLVILVALSVGAAVAVSGVVGFAGLVVPHLLRLAIGPDHRRLLPGSALLGAALVLFADVLARTVVAPAELPLGVVTASVGAPFFIALLMRERRKLV